MISVFNSYSFLLFVKRNVGPSPLLPDQRVPELLSVGFGKGVRWRSDWGPLSVHRWEA